jgi:hypothetical protein
VPTGIVIAPVDAVPTNPDTATLVAEAAPSIGVTRVGEVPNTLSPLPVEVVVPVPPPTTGSPVQFVSIPLEGVPKAPPDASRVPVVAGRVITVVPATDGAAIVTEPDVSPAMTILDIFILRV